MPQGRSCCRPLLTWAPEDKENLAGEKTRKVKLMLSTEPGNLNGKTLNKEFRIFRTGSPEEWILWRRDFNEICVGMAIFSRGNHNRMVRQLFSDELITTSCSTIVAPSRRFWSMTVPFIKFAVGHKSFLDISSKFSIV